MRNRFAYPQTEQVIALRLDKRQFGLHLPWFIVACVLLLGGGTWYAWSCLQRGELPGGGSAVGLSCGVLAAAIIAFEMLLWPRKLLRRLRLFPARYWMAAHIWLGIASAPLALLHSGFHWGGWLPTMLMAIFLLTIASGLYGLALQNIVPKLQLQHIPGETIYSQIEHVCRLAVDDLRMHLVATCEYSHSDNLLHQAGSNSYGPPLERIDELVIVGKVRDNGRLTGKVMQRQFASDSMSRIRDRASCNRLWDFFNLELAPYILGGKRSNSPLVHRDYALERFSSLAIESGALATALIENMRASYEQRQQLDRQKSYHHWLHGWLPVHIALSVATCVLLCVHIVTAIKYW